MRLVSFRRSVRPPTYHTVHEAGVVKEVGEATYLSHRPWGWCRSGGRWGRSCPPGTWGSPPPSSPAGSPHSKHTWYHAEKRPESLFTNLAIDSISKSIMDLLEIPVQYRYFVQWWFFSLAYKNKDIRTAPPPLFMIIYEYKCMPFTLKSWTTLLLQAVHWEKAGPVGRNWLNPKIEPLATTVPRLLPWDLGTGLVSVPFLS